MLEFFKCLRVLWIINFVQGVQVLRFSMFWSCPVVSSCVGVSSSLVFEGFRGVQLSFEIVSGVSSVSSFSDVSGVSSLVVFRVVQIVLFFLERFRWFSNIHEFPYVNGFQAFRVLQVFQIGSTFFR